MALVLLFLCCLFSPVIGKYEPTWESLDSRPLPEWYDKAKFGIFIHWGIYSVPSIVNEWFWLMWENGHPEILEYMGKNYPPGFSYAEFAPLFKAEFFNPNDWADLLQASGAKYVVLTSKHHEGYTLWPSSRSWNWNSMDVGPKRDLVGELARSIRWRTNLRFGLYHSLYEWFNPLYMSDRASSFRNQSFVKSKMLPELFDLVNTYQPEVLWSDGEWDAPDTYWKSKEFLTWLYNESPVNETVVTNDRWGSNCWCKHGGYYTCQDRFNPGVLQEHKWENCMTIDKKSWGYRRNAPLSHYFTIEELITTLATTVSCGGNLLMNIGPTKEGTITPIYEERLRQMGQWLSINGDAIFETVPWIHQNDTLNPNVWYTSKVNQNGVDTVYAIVLKWPESVENILMLESPKPDVRTEVSMLGVKEPLVWTGGDTYPMLIEFPRITHDKLHWAWVLKFTRLNNTRS